MYSTHTYIRLCKQKLLFWMRLITINNLTALVIIAGISFCQEGPCQRSVWYINTDWYILNMLPVILSVQTVCYAANWYLLCYFSLLSQSKIHCLQNIVFFHLFSYSPIVMNRKEWITENNFLLCWEIRWTWQSLTNFSFLMREGWSNYNVLQIRIDTLPHYSY